MGLDFLQRTAASFKARCSQKLQDLLDQRLFDRPSEMRWVLKAAWDNLNVEVPPGSPCLLRVYAGKVMVFFDGRRIGVVIDPPAHVVDSLIEKGAGMCAATIERTALISRTLDVALN